MSKYKIIDLYDYSKLKDAEKLEDVLCLATLIAVGRLPGHATITESNYVWDGLYKQECSNCPYMDKCLACIINE